MSEQGPYLIGVWRASLLDVTTFASKHYLGDRVVQIIRDPQMPGAYWLMLRVTGDQRKAFKELTNPRLTVIP